MAKARHITYLREERSTCRVRSSRRDPKIREIPLFFHPLSQNLTKSLKNLSNSSLFLSRFLTFWPPDSQLFDLRILNFLDPLFWNPDPRILTFWPRNLRNLSLFGVTFCHFFQFWGSLFVTFNIFSLFWHFFHFFVTFFTFFIRGGHFFTFWGGVEIGVKNGSKKRSEMPISETHIS